MGETGSMTHISIFSQFPATPHAVKLKFLLVGLLGTTGTLIAMPTIKKCGQFSNTRCNYDFIAGYQESRSPVIVN